jgi:uncharacterized protein (DUF1330 family)
MSENTVYALLDVIIKDRGKFMEYVEGHRASFQKYGGKLLFRSNDMEMIEGNWSPKLFVMHEWPSEDAFKNWFNSKEYEPWKRLREEAMDMNMVLAKKMPD